MQSTDNDADNGVGLNDETTIIYIGKHKNNKQKQTKVGLWQVYTEREFADNMLAMLIKEDLKELI